MTALAFVALAAVLTLVVLGLTRRSRTSRRVAVGDGSYVYVDGGAGSDCSSGSDAGGCGGDGGGGGGGD